MDQSNLLRNIVEFNYKSRPRTIESKDKKEILMKNYEFSKINSSCFQKWNISKKRKEKD